MLRAAACSAALLAMLAAHPAAARPERDDALASYVRARAAATAGAIDAASADFAAALAAAPGNQEIAAHALSHAVGAGDWPLALSAARMLDAEGALLPDGRFLLLADALKRESWAEAAAQIDAIEKDELFAFTVPALRAWHAMQTGSSDPLAALQAAGTRGAAAHYAVEHGPLIMIALGSEGGPAALEAVVDRFAGRAVRLRIAAASALAGRGDRATALALLSGEEPPIRVAHAMIEDGRIVPGPIDGAVSGVAELYVRLALDLNREDLGPLALGLARLATYLAPDNSEAWLVASELLAAEDRQDEAIAALAHVAADDPYAANVRDQRIRLLQAAGEGERALVEARALAEGAADATLADWMRLGDALERLGRHREAADVYERAIALGERDSPVEHWALWLLRGSALYNAGDWPAARTALRKAHRLAPDNPLVLNYLGYSLLTRREDMAEAEAMIREANRIAPDNAAITDSLGWALYLKGELPEAIALLERAAQAEPADVEINEHLGDAYYSAGRRIEARFAWRAALVHAEGEDAERLRAKIDTGLTPRLAAR